MKIQLIIFEFDYKTKRTKEFKTNYIGNYALETMILSLIEKYYSPKIMEQVRNVLTNKINGV